MLFGNLELTLDEYNGHFVALCEEFKLLDDGEQENEVNKHKFLEA